MALCLADSWLWDFWCVAAGEDYHVFYLVAPRSLGDPDARHWNVRIGHAISTDLTHWSVLEDVIGPGPTGAWDDYTTWTGSVIRYGDRWAMLYTGTCRAERGLVQRIGLAWSHDLTRWEKDPSNPVLEIDEQRYEILDTSIWHDQAWRDPWVFLDPDEGRFHAFVTARVRSGPPAYRGVIAHAVSDDLVAWTSGDPVTKPGVFGHLEIPQLVQANHRWFLVFSAPGMPDPGDGIGAAAMLTGTHYLSADSPLGPFEWSTHGLLLADRQGSRYGTKLIQTFDADWIALAWENNAQDGHFVGTLTDPMPVDFDDAPRVRPTMTP